MRTITVLTPANIEIEYYLAGAGSRLAAFAVDLLLQLAACLVVSCAILFGPGGYRTKNLYAVSGWPLAAVIIFCFAVFFCYFIVCETALNGQSAGKKIFGLRVISDNGQPVGLTQSIVRGLFRISVDMLYVGLFVIMFSKKHKRIGDMAAGTVVVTERYDKAVNSEFTIMPSNSDTRLIEPQYSHINISDDELALIKAYVKRKETLPGNGESIRKKLAAHLAAKWNVHENFFSDEVLIMLCDLKAVK
ncbi:MAG: RDD family protein [Defluviitaleaceae bacterium]|nr:RDD family protein [Defluviitaleaceae bacterium]